MSHPLTASSGQLEAAGSSARMAQPLLRGRPRRPGRVAQEPLPLLRGHRCSGRGRGRPRGCGRPPGPGGAALPTEVLPRRLPGIGDPDPGQDQAGTAHRGIRVGPGAWSDRHRSRRVPAGVRAPHFGPPAPRQAPHPPRGRPDARGDRPATGCRRTRKHLGGPGASPKSASSPPSTTTRTDGGRWP